MNRRRFIKIAGLSLLAGGGLIATGRLLDLWRTPQVTLITPLPALPTIITRAEWGAKPVNHAAPEEAGFVSDDNPTGWLVYEGDLRDVYHTVVIHHSADINPHTMRDMQAVHMDRQGWADIGYHFAVDSDGLIYAGHDIHARGASVAGHNTGAVGVVDRKSVV